MTILLTLSTINVMEIRSFLYGTLRNTFLFLHESWYGMFSKNASRYQACGFFTLLFSLLAHGYRYYSLCFSGDAMLLTQQGEAVYQSTLGRYLQPVYWMIRGEMTVPPIIGLFATAFLMLSCMLMANLFRLDRKRDIALLSALLVTHETFAVSNATYLPWTDVYALALLFATAGAYVFLLGGARALLSIPFFFLSLGLYQSYLPVAAVLIILVLIRRTLDGAKPKDTLLTGLAACGCILAGLILYAVVLKIVMNRLGSIVSDEYNGVGALSHFAYDRIGEYLLQTLLTPIRFLFVPGASDVIPSHTPAISPVLNLLLLALCGVMLFPRAKDLPAASKGMLLLLVLLLVPAMNFVQFIAQGLASGLTIYAYVFFDVAVLLLAASALNAQSRFCRLAARGAQLLLCVIIAQNTFLSNRLAFKRDVEWSSTLSAMTRVLDRIEQTEGYVPGETPVVLVGILTSSSISMTHPGFESLESYQGARYTYAASYETSTYWYLKMALGARVNLVDEDERRIRSTPAVTDSLTIFPDAQCCQMIDGVLYIRLG